MAEPQLITSGKIAATLNQPISRVLRVLATRSHIRPAARAGIIRLYRKEALAQVRHELNTMDARRQPRRPATGKESTSC